MNFGVVCLTAILFLSFFSCDSITAGDAKDIAVGSAATRAVSDVAGSSACGVAGEMAGVDGADRSRRHRGAAGVAGSAVGKASGEGVTKDLPAGSIEADCNADELSSS